MAQWESVRFTRGRSLVRSQPGPPSSRPFGRRHGRLLPDRARWATINGVSKVTLTTELPIPVETASALARKPEMMRHVLSPVLRIYRLDVPERIEVGTQWPDPD